MKHFILSLAFLFVFSAEGFSQLDSGLVGNYLFSGNTSDSSGKGNHGLVEGIGTLSEDRFGNAMSAYTFAIDDSSFSRIILPDSSVLGILNSMTVSFWIKTNQSDTNGWNEAVRLIDKDVTGFNRDWSVRLGKGGKILFNTGTVTKDSVLASSLDVNDNTWKHVVVIRDKSKKSKSIYLNGTLDDTAKFDNGTFSNDSNNIYLGNWELTTDSVNNSYAYTGKLDDIRIYNRALSAAEVGALYALHTGSIAGVVFDDANNSAAKDSGEAGIEGWKVFLAGDKVDTTTTDSSGSYSFGSLFPGTYIVTEENQAGWNETFPVSGADTIVLGEDQNSTGNDFGNFQYGVITGTVYDDPNKNGVHDSGEVGLANWKVYLAGVVAETTTTNLNGEYSFSSLASGGYNITVDSPSDKVGTYPPLGTYILVVTTSGSYTGNNFELYQIPTYRTFKTTDGFISKPVKMKFLKKTKLAASPNEATILEGEFKKIGKNSVVLLGIKQTVKDSIKKYAWVEYVNSQNNAGGTVQKLFKTAHTGAAYPLDSIRKSSAKPKKMKGAIKPDSKNYNNVAIEQGVLYNLNLKASTDSILPYGLGNLIFNPVATVTFAGQTMNGKSLSDMGKLMDSAMTYVKQYGMDTDSGHTQLQLFIDSTIRLINTTFAKDIDSTNFTVSDSNAIKKSKNPYAMRLLGVKTAAEAGFLNEPAKSATQIHSLSGYNEPSKFVLNQNYPNPFNPTTTITFGLATKSIVSLKVYNVLGQQVATILNNEQFDAGKNEVEFDASALSSGVYFYRLTAGAFTATKKLMLLK